MVKAAKPKAAKAAKAPRAPKAAKPIEGVAAEDITVNEPPKESPAESVADLLNALLQQTHQLPAEQQEPAQATINDLADAINETRAETAESNEAFVLAHDATRSAFLGGAEAVATEVNRLCSRIHKLVISEAPVSAEETGA